MLILLYLGAVALTTWALLDVAQTPADQTRTLAKPSWALVAVLPYVGPAAWFLLGTERRSGGRARGGDQGGRPLGPDDDPEFLRELGRRRDRPD
ncbi:MAG: PLD nuclease N-terminal domain-containing protein [Actinomycetes bacterium]